MKIKDIKITEWGEGYISGLFLGTLLGIVLSVLGILFILIFN